MQRKVIIFVSTEEQRSELQREFELFPKITSSNRQLLIEKKCKVKCKYG